MAMMMTGRVLLVCALCVLWCGAGCLCEEMVTTTSDSEVNNPKIESRSREGDDLTQSKDNKGPTHSEGVENHDAVTLPGKGTCKNGSPDPTKCTQDSEVVIVSPSDPVGQKLHNEVEDRGNPGPSGKDTTRNDQEVQERSQYEGTLLQEKATVKGAKSTMAATHLLSPSPPNGTHETVSSKETSADGDGTVQRDNKLNGNDGSTSRTAQPDSISANTPISDDKDTSSNDGAPLLNTAADTDNEESTIKALNPTDTNMDNSGGGDSSLVASPAVRTNTAATTTTSTQDASKFNTDGVNISIEDVEQNASKTHPDADSGTTETAEDNSKVLTTANNATNKTSNTETTADSDVSTAASLTTSPLVLLIVACAAVAAVVAA
ncbi:mucin-associated surface protein (MASP), putative [Trypanosoma cruzi marinkellei]|uniref:Mucin-associated surface protein (MASP), putative n=1 Tax=Trypanosoma cruzi marinkellei TaxID=85056 RepID=K2LXB7_TRYCR|nr:mucin-associated surface protein (MASP), putative [Trypanosoma cruzi marinkellei]